ncbi:MAG TPA: IclR family transcriptional regulator [Pseudolabrys sp.]|nr:IclR family transcriptional regulator [Pseudolabrys sp.]
MPERAAEAAPKPAEAPARHERPRSVNSTADRAIDILLAFTSEKPVWSAAEIAQHFKMPRSTTYRYINTLKNCGLLAEEASNLYRLGHKVLHLARVAKVHDPILRVAAPVLSELASIHGDTVLLHERVGHEVITLERLESRHPHTATMSQSRMLPWPAAASAKVLLAFADPAEREEILSRTVPIRYTDKTLVTHKALLADLKTIARQGYCVGIEEFDEGAAGVAAPIFVDNTCTYAISLGGDSAKFHGKRLTEMVKHVTTAAARISKTLAGYG